MTVPPLLCHKTTSANAQGAEQNWGEEGLKAMQSAWHLIQAWPLQALGKGLASNERHLLGGMLRATPVPSTHLRERRMRRGKAQSGKKPLCCGCFSMGRGRGRSRVSAQTGCAQRCPGP